MVAIEDAQAVFNDFQVIGQRLQFAGRNPFVLLGAALKRQLRKQPMEIAWSEASMFLLFRSYPCINP
jgi:hypothetical protein